MIPIHRVQGVVTALALATTVAASTPVILQQSVDPEVRFTDRNKSLLVSQIGYTRAGLRTAYLMAADRTTGDAVTSFTVEDSTGTIVYTGVPSYRGEWVTRHFWELEFSDVDAVGRYRVRAGDLTSNEFPIKAKSAGLYLGPHERDMIFEQLRARVVYDPLGGFIEAGNDIRATDSVATLFLGVLDLLQMYPERFSDQDRDEVDGWARHAHAFYESLQTPEGMIGFGWYNGSPMCCGRWPQHLLGSQSLLRIARYYALVAPGYAATVRADAQRAIEYTRVTLNPAAAPSTWLTGALRGEVELHRQTGAAAALLKAREIAAELRLRQTPNTAPSTEGLWGGLLEYRWSTELSRLNYHGAVDNGGEYWGLPLDSLLDLAAMYPDDPDAATWRATVNDFVNGFLRPAAERSPLGLVANGEYDGVRWFSDLFHGMTMTYALEALWLLRYAEGLGDPTLVDLAERQLLWIGGLNTGHSFVGGAEPVSFIVGKGYQWLQDGHGIFSDIPGSMVNGVSATQQFMKEMPVGPERPLKMCNESWISHTGAWLAAASELVRARLAVRNTLRMTRDPLGDSKLTWSNVPGALSYTAYRGDRAGRPLTDVVGSATDGAVGVTAPATGATFELYRVTGSNVSVESPQ